MNDKLKTLQAILDNCGFDFVHVNDYDFTQPDSMDESDSGGVWDLAGFIADWCCSGCSGTDTDTDDYDKINSYLQSLLYNLMCDYKDEQDDE